MGALLTFIGVVIAIVIWYRRLTGAQRLVDTLKKRSQPAPRSTRKPVAQTLERDPDTGVYRPPTQDG